MIEDDELRPGPASAVSLLSWNRHGDTELTLAAASGDLEELRRLLAGGADPLHRNAKGHCALVRAARQGHAEAISLLTADWDPDILTTPEKERLALDPMI
ncbi:MAG: ankyrin repeat domain-containing protein [Noviherbaspirillum sp.]